MSSNLIRWGGLASILAGVAWAFAGTVAFVTNGPGPLGSTSSYVIESLHAIAMAGILVSLIGLHARQASRSGRLGLVGFIGAFLGTALLLLAILVVLVALDYLGEDVLNILFGGGVLSTFAGFVVLGIATLRARVLPVWYGLLLVAYPFVFFVSLPVPSAGVVSGLIWLTLGYVLSKQGHISAVQSMPTTSSNVLQDNTTM